MICIHSLAHCALLSGTRQWTLQYLVVWGSFLFCPQLILWNEKALYSIFCNAFKIHKIGRRNFWTVPLWVFEPFHSKGFCCKCGDVHIGSKARYSVLRGSYYGFQTMIFTFQMNCFDQHCMNCINIIANPIFLAVETWDNQSSETMSFEIGGKTKRSRDHWDEEYDEGKVKKVKKHHGHPSSKKSSHGNQFQKLQDRRNNEKVGKLWWFVQRSLSSVCMLLRVLFTYFSLWQHCDTFYAWI